MTTPTGSRRWFVATGLSGFALLASGCYLSHELDTVAPPVPMADAAPPLRDAGLPTVDGEPRDSGPTFVPMCPGDLLAEAERIDALSARVGILGPAPDRPVRAIVTAVGPERVQLQPVDASIPPFEFGWVVAGRPLDTWLREGQEVDCGPAGDWTLLSGAGIGTNLWVQSGIGAARVVPPSASLEFGLRNVCDMDVPCGDEASTARAFALEASYMWGGPSVILNAGGRGTLGDGIDTFHIQYDGAVEITGVVGPMCAIPGLRAVVQIEEEIGCVC